MNTPDPHHWTLNSCFGAFLSVRVHFGPFRYCTKLGTKRAKLVQLMQKFVQRCLVRIFHNERSRSTPLDPKLIFWCISIRLGAFGTVSLLHETRCKWANLVQLMHEFVPQSLVGISRNRRTRSTQLDPKLRFSCVSFRLGAFGTIMLLYKLDAKRAKLVQLMQKFVPRSVVRNFRNERTRSTPLEYKLMFWCVSFWTKLGEKRQTGAINANVHARCRARIFRNERSRSTPLDPKLMFWCVSFRLGAFGTISSLH